MKQDVAEEQKPHDQQPHDYQVPVSCCWCRWGIGVTTWCSAPRTGSQQISSVIETRDDLALGEISLFTFTEESCHTKRAGFQNTFSI